MNSRELVCSEIVRAARQGEVAAYDRLLGDNVWAGDHHQGRIVDESAKKLSG